MIVSLQETNEPRIKHCGTMALEGLTPEEFRKGLEFETHNEFLERLVPNFTPEQERKADKLDGYKVAN